MKVITVLAQRAALASAVAVPAVVVTVVTVVETANQKGGSLITIGMHLKWALMQRQQLATTGCAVVAKEVWDCDCYEMAKVLFSLTFL